MKDPFNMDKETYIKSDPAFQRAKAKLDALQTQDSARWGETRRFAGRSAGNRLDKLSQARAQWSRAYDRAAARFEKINMEQAQA